MSLFNAGLHCAVSTSEGTALFEDDEGLAAFSRVVKGAPFSALDVKQALHRVYPADTSERALSMMPTSWACARSTWGWPATC